jgi:hypothetical protein
VNGDWDVGVVLAEGEPALRIDARLKDERRLLENLGPMSTFLRIFVKKFENKIGIIYLQYTTFHIFTIAYKFKSKFPFW